MKVPFGAPPALWRAAVAIAVGVGVGLALREGDVVAFALIGVCGLLALVVAWAES